MCGMRATVEKEKFRNSGHRLLQHCSGARDGTRTLTQLFIVDNVRCSFIIGIVWNVFAGVQVAGVRCHYQIVLKIQCKLTDGMMAIGMPSKLQGRSASFYSYILESLSKFLLISIM